MPSFLPKSLQKLIEEFSKLPGIGPKSAQRLAMHLLYSPEKRSLELAEAIQSFKKDLQFCKNCWNIAENELCGICSDPNRNHQQICVVEELLDVMALEKTAEYRGSYHVLHGVLSPIDAVGPEQLKIQELLQRIENMNKPELELILATNPSLEGETTAMYLMRLLKPKEVRITRIARGLPAGGDLDYADELTLTRALQGRVKYE
jgi:recombination protein RecR